MFFFGVSDSRQRAREAKRRARQEAQRKRRQSIRAVVLLTVLATMLLSTRWLFTKYNARVQAGKTKPAGRLQTSGQHAGARVLQRGVSAVEVGGRVDGGRAGEVRVGDERADDERAGEEDADPVEDSDSLDDEEGGHGPVITLAKRRAGLEGGVNSSAASQGSGGGAGARVAAKDVKEDTGLAERLAARALDQPASQFVIVHDRHDRNVY